MKTYRIATIPGDGIDYALLRYQRADTADLLGAHRDPQVVAANLKKALIEALNELGEQTAEALLARRFDRLMAYGRYTEKPVEAG